ncbi:prolipoprotein diacylglyceryl transferase [Hyphomonas sp.]|uniref:prolipoprotein diacylglyceryl transferase n=1 Tax=Hyphomonas sp. TaxID=87 RepID=UPI0025B85FE5|nr:prolipoprotein diacylglyceryl transferase [Hyphomonas sp.]
MTELLTMMSVYLGQAVMTFPEWRPALLSLDFGFVGLGEFHLRWYALGYIAGIGGAWWYGSQLLKRASLWKSEPPLSQEGLDDLMFWIIIGIILGGRFGYVLFYMVPYQMDVLAADPLTVLRIWDGGMAFHGGILGVALVLWFFAAKRGVPLLSVGDIAGVTAPIGIGLVRIANFTNAELYGRPTEASIGMVFPEGYVPGSTPPAFNWETNEWVYRGDELARHPSQLYESVLEGWIPLIVLSILIWKFGALKRPGLVAGLFLLMYGAGRSIAENFREPDSFVSGLPEWLTMGMILSVPMWLGGAWLIWNALKRQEKQV